MSANEDEETRAEAIDLRAELDPETRRLWTKMFPSGIDTSVPGYALELWSFGYACMILHAVPDVVTREMERRGCNDYQPLLYMRARRAAYDREKRAAADAQQANPSAEENVRWT